MISEPWLTLSVTTVIVFVVGVLCRRAFGPSRCETLDSWKVVDDD